MKCIAATLLLFSCMAGAQPATDETTLALIHANVIDGASDEVLRDTTVLVRGGRIERVGPAPAPTGSQVLDLEGRWLLPGLIDAHAHVTNLAGARRVLEQGVDAFKDRAAVRHVEDLEVDRQTVEVLSFDEAACTSVPRTRWTPRTGGTTAAHGCTVRRRPRPTATAGFSSPAWRARRCSPTLPSPSPAASASWSVGV